MAARAARASSRSAEWWIATLEGSKATALPSDVMLEVLLVLAADAGGVAVPEVASIERAVFMPAYVQLAAVIVMLVHFYGGQSAPVALQLLRNRRRPAEPIARQAATSADRGHSVREAGSGLGADVANVEWLGAFAADHDGVHVVIACGVVQDERRAFGPGQPPVPPGRHGGEDRVGVAALVGEPVLESWRVLLVLDAARALLRRRVATAVARGCCARCRARTGSRRSGGCRGTPGG